MVLMMVGYWCMAMKPQPTSSSTIVLCCVVLCVVSCGVILKMKGLICGCVCDSVHCTVLC
jgi:hypothetical protein